MRSTLVTQCGDKQTAGFDLGYASRDTPSVPRRDSATLLRVPNDAEGMCSLRHNIRALNIRGLMEEHPDEMRNTGYLSLIEFFSQHVLQPSPIPALLPSPIGL